MWSTKMTRRTKTKAVHSRQTNLGHSFWVSKQGSLEGISSLKSFPISPLIRMILPAKITSSKLQNSSQRCKHLDLPHSLSPGTVVDGEFSPKRGLHYFHLLEYWSQGKGKEKVTNPHLLLERHNWEEIWIIVTPTHSILVMKIGFAWASASRGNFTLGGGINY